MYLSVIYEKYISIQNKFLNDVIESINNNCNHKNNKKLEYIKEKINEEIKIQNSNKYNLINFSSKRKNLKIILIL